MKKTPVFLLAVSIWALFGCGSRPLTPEAKPPSTVSPPTAQAPQSTKPKIPRPPTTPTPEETKTEKEISELIKTTGEAPESAPAQDNIAEGTTITSRRFSAKLGQRYVFKIDYATKHGEGCEGITYPTSPYATVQMISEAKKMLADMLEECVVIDIPEIGVQLTFSPITEEPYLLYHYKDFLGEDTFVSNEKLKAMVHQNETVKKVMGADIAARYESGEYIDLSLIDKRLKKPVEISFFTDGTDRMLFEPANSDYTEKSFYVFSGITDVDAFYTHLKKLGLCADGHFGPDDIDFLRIFLAEKYPECKNECLDKELCLLTRTPNRVNMEMLKNYGSDYFGDAFSLFDEIFGGRLGFERFECLNQEAVEPNHCPLFETSKFFLIQ